MPKVAVIGLGTFGREVAISLSQQNFQVLAIDSDEETIENIKNKVHQAVTVNALDEKALYELKLDEMNIVVNAIGSQNIEASILVTALLHQLEVPRIIARTTNELQEQILRKVGATEVINPERAIGKKIAYQISHPGVREVFPLSVSHCLAEIPIPSRFVGKNLAELRVRTKYNINVVGIRRVKKISISKERKTFDSFSTPDSLLEENRELILNISPEDIMNDSDILIILGKDTDINQLASLG